MRNVPSSPRPTVLAFALALGACASALAVPPQEGGEAAPSTASAWFDASWFEGLEWREVGPTAAVAARR